MIKVMLILYGAVVFAFTLLPLAIYGANYLRPDPEFDSAILELIDRFEEEDSPSFELAYGLYGFGAPSGEDPIEFGRSLINQFRMNAEFPELSNQLLYSFNSAEFCEFRTDDRCGDEIVQTLDSVPGLMDENTELLTRYERLQLNDAFSEPLSNFESMRAVSVPPITRYLLDTSKLLSRHIVYLARNGQQDQAWNLWNKEFHFHRRLLQTSDFSGNKEIARVLIEEDIRLRLFLLGLGNIDPSIPSLFRLSLEERSFEKVIRRHVMAMIEPILEGADREELARHFQVYWFGRALSSNIFNSSIDASFRLASIHPRAFSNRLFLPLLDLMDAQYGEMSEFKKWYVPYVGNAQNFNLILTFQFFSEENAMYLHGMDTFVWRYYDLDRFIFLAQVAENALEAGIDSTGIDNWLLSLQPQLRDPLTGDLPTWQDGVLQLDTSARTEVVIRQSIPLNLQ